MADMTPRTGRRRSGNQRDDVARLAVLHAADDLLVENGFGGLTIEAIARRAGVAKQTIYRWWPSKVEILLDTLVEDAGKKLPVPAEDATMQAIGAYLWALAQFVTIDPAGKVLLALVAESQHDPETATKVHEQFLDPRRAQERALLTRAIDAGEVRPQLGADHAIDALVGPIYYRALTGSTISRAFVEAIVDDVLQPRAR